MLVDNLSKGILEPCSVKVGNVLDEFCLNLLESFNLLGEFSLHPAKLHLLVSGPLLQFGHLSLSRFKLFFLAEVAYLLIHSSFTIGEDQNQLGQFLLLLLLRQSRSSLAFAFTKARSS